MDQKPAPVTDAITLAEAEAAVKRETARLMEGYKGDEPYPDDDESLGWDPEVDGE